MTNFSFSPKTIATEIEKKLAIKRLPSWAQNSEQIQKYFDDCVQHWFTPEQQKTLDGYIGKRSGANSTNKVFVNEITPDRTEYQLAAAMVSTDETNTVLKMLTYPDLVDNLAFNGCLADNESRLLSGRVYCWAPAINPDMLINYASYYWDTSKPGLAQPDYVIMQRGSIDGNLWSFNNNWYPIQYKDELGNTVLINNDDITSGKFIQARRPIIEYKKNIELYNFGRNTRGYVDLVATNLVPADIMFRDISHEIYIDGQAIRNNDRILFTNIDNSGENNRIYKVITDIQNGKEVYGLTLDISEQTPSRPTGEPELNDTLRVIRGAEFSNLVIFWNGKKWVKGQQKTQRNQSPLFQLYDKEAVALTNNTKYPLTTFKGSPIFDVEIDKSSSIDSVFGRNIKKDKYGNFIYNNRIETDVFTYTRKGVDYTVSGMKFYNVMNSVPSKDQLYSDWIEASVQSRQYVTQTITPTTYYENVDTSAVTYNTKYKLATTVGVNPIGVNYPLVKVDIGGDELSPSQYVIDGDEIEFLDVKFNPNTTISVLIYNNTQTPDTEIGAYEIPSNLKNNAANSAITVVEASQLTDHFYDIIQNQKDFEGSPFGLNNYYNSERDMSVGRKIVQHDASLIPLMVHNSDEKLSIIDAANFVKNNYNNFKNKFNNVMLDITPALNGNALSSALVETILTKINVGKSSEFAFYLSGMGTTTNIQTTFIPQTPQFIGINQTYMPKIRVRLAINGDNDETLYNISHTGVISKAYSTLSHNQVEDDIIFQLEMNIFKSINSAFTNEDYIPSLSIYDVKPGVFRQTEYTVDEWERIARRSFEQWVVSNVIDYTTNDTFDVGDWRTWNYSTSSYNITNTTARGNWKAIYMDHFDTISPNTTPWEMLGFTIKPLWWNEEYTETVLLSNGNTAYVGDKLWGDIETGFIRRGSRQGIDSRFARAQFTIFNPVADDGTLVAPHLSVPGRVSLVDKIPSEPDGNWKYGDMANIEFSYMNSNHYTFEQAIMTYRAKPAQWSNYFWNTPAFDLYKSGTQVQWLHVTNDTRLRFDSNTLVHGENDNRFVGYQMWVADSLKHSHIDITRNYGNIVRGAGVKLTYRLGGYSKKENLTFVSDSFGLVSQENQQLTLLKSTVRRQEVLSGIKVEYSKGAYFVSGYDSSSPYFNYFEPIKTGKRYAVTLNNRSYVQYQVYKQTPVELKYGTKFKSIQEVYDFMVGYGEYLDSVGWIFEELTEDGEFFDWRVMAAQFVNWASGKRVTNDYISLSPAPRTVKFVTEHGNIDSVTQMSGGSWTLIDDNNSGISVNEINVARIGNIINIRLNSNVDKRIMLVRMNINEYEHAVVFDNTTIFGDIIYLPVYGLHQLQLRVYGYITDGWNGRLEAPGFMIVGNDTLPNFEKLVNDFTHYYDNENPTSSVELNNLARHVIGYQSREYLRRLIVNERNQLDFYKGYIKEKGTIQSFDKVLRSSKNLRTPNYKVIEEWAFKIGEYGDVDNDQRLEFLLSNSDIKQEPQNVIFNANTTSDSITDDIITYFGKKGDDTRWLTRSSNTQKFPLISRDSIDIDLPSIGPVNLTDVDIVVTNINDMYNVRRAYVEKYKKMPERIWMLDNRGTWDILVLNQTTIIPIYSYEPLGSSSVLVNFVQDHQVQDNDIFVLYADNDVEPELNKDTYFVYNPAVSDMQLVINNAVVSDLKVFRDGTAEGWDVPLPGTPRLYLYQSMFANKTERDLYLTQRNTDVVNIKSFSRPVIYNKDTNTTDTYLTLWDPIQGVIPGIADAEIKFKSQHDPAMYNNMIKDGAAWGSTQVGTVWWDTSTALYIDYTQPVANDIDGSKTREYRRDNWGKMLPSGEIVLYEWVKSPVHPVDWNDYVIAQNALNKSHSAWIPSGDALVNNWSEFSEYDSNSNDYKTYYYFWISNAIHVPNIKYRNRSISEIARIINDPSSLNLPWFAPISENEFLISGITTLITSDSSVLQLVYRADSETSNVHKQWQLFQEGTSYNFDTDIWQSMIDSLCGVSLPNVNGDTTLMIYPNSELGMSSNQTWFKNRFNARREFAEAANLYFKTTNITSNSVYMHDVFNYIESEVNIHERDVNIVTVDGVILLQIDNNLRFNNNDAVTLTTNDLLPSPLDNSLTYFIERVVGKDNLFNLKISPNANDVIQLTNKGNGSLKILRVKDSDVLTTTALDMTKYWDVADWYAEGYSANTSFVDASSTTEANQMNLNEGDVIRVFDDNDVWSLYVKGLSRDISIWNTVGRKNSTVQLNDFIFEEVDTFTDSGEFTSREFVLHKALRKLSTVFVDAQSLILFPLVYFVHNEQKVVDWVFKTSYISILGIDKSIREDSVTHSDPISDVTDYVNEVKPYRTKIRSSIDQRTSDDDTILAKMWDTDSDLVNDAAYYAEYSKLGADQDFGKIASNFRQQVINVFFDHVSVNAPNDLVDQFVYEQAFKQYMVQNDNDVRFASEITVVNAPNPVFNAVYTEIVDHTLYPVFSDGFNVNPLSTIDVNVNRRKGVYHYKLDNTDYYVWCMTSGGWIISTANAFGVDWYYEDISKSNNMSVENVNEVTSWLSANKLISNVRGTARTLINVSITKETSIDIEKDFVSERFKRNALEIEYEMINDVSAYLSTTHGITRLQFNTVLHSFIMNEYDGSSYLNVTAYRDVMSSAFNLTDAEILKSLTVGYTKLKLINDYLNTAARVKIYNPDASDEYIKSVVNGGFKGQQIQNQPTINGYVGYDAQSDADKNGYTLWNTDLYDKQVKDMRANGITESVINSTLASYGFGNLVTYVPYTGSNVNVLDKSIEIKSDLNTLPWNGNNPFINDAIPLLDGFANVSSNYDNLGYDKQTRSMIIDEVVNNAYIYNIDELQIEDDSYGKLTLTISNYQPPVFSNIDFGKLDSAGNLIPGTTVGSLIVDYLRKDDWSQDVSMLFSWDFGNKWGDITYQSLCVEGVVIRDPLNASRVVVSAPRSVDIFAKDWNKETTVYPSNDKKLYPFSVSNIPTSVFRIGAHELKDGDEVILFSNDNEIKPSGASFNQIDVLYTVKVVDTDNVKLFTNTNTPVTLLGPTTTESFLPNVVLSMFHVIKPQSLNELRIDTLNYSKFYGRFMSGGNILKIDRLDGASGNIIVPNHKLSTGDKVIFTSINKNAPLGNVVLDQEYFVIVRDHESIDITNTIDDALANINLVQVGLGINTTSLVVVNFWISSTTQSTRRERSWHTAYDMLNSSIDRIDMMQDQFVDGELISAPTDSIVDHGFARPTIDDGSLRDLVRMRLQEHVSITVLQDERALTASASSKVFDKNGILMYNKLAGSAKPFAFKFTKSYNTQVWHVARLADIDVVKTIKETWYNDNTITVDKTLPPSGVVVVNGEYISYSKTDNVLIGSVNAVVLSKLQRGFDYTHEGAYIASDVNVVLASGPNQQIDMQLSRDSLFSPNLVNANEYAYASTLLCALDGVYTKELKNDTSIIATQLKEHKASFALLGIDQFSV